jgi:polar amino acid transport system substrate-binding protein
LKRLSAGELFAALALALSLIAASSASAQTVDEIIARGKLIVAIDTTTPPYGFLGADLKPTGFDIEVANKMGEALGVPVEFVTVTSPGRIPALLTKQVDAVISIFSITPARAIQIDYSIPYAGQSAVVIAPPRAPQSKVMPTWSARRWALRAARVRTGC